MSEQLHTYLVRPDWDNGDDEWLMIARATNPEEAIRLVLKEIRTDTIDLVQFTGTPHEDQLSDYFAVWELPHLSDFPRGTIPWPDATYWRNTELDDL